jgi:hypothetical protein
MENKNRKKRYKKAKARAKNFYGKVGRLWSPALRDYVGFNSMGFRHLIWKGRERRPQSQQIARFSLLPLAVETIVDPNIKISFGKKREYTFSKWQREKRKIISEAKFWALHKKKGNKFIRVIVRQVGEGKKHFFSVFYEGKTKKQKTAF